jgi:hypothetical protein
MTDISFRLLSRAAFYTEGQEGVRFEDRSPPQVRCASRIHHRQVPAVTIIPEHCAAAVGREYSATIRVGAVGRLPQFAVDFAAAGARYRQDLLETADVITRLEKILALMKADRQTA